MKRLVVVDPTAQGGRLETRAYATTAARSRALPQLRRHWSAVVPYRDVAGPAVQLVRDDRPAVVGPEPGPNYNR